MRRGALFAALLAAAAAGTTAGASEAGSPPAETPPRDTREASVIRGGIVFRTYCVLCHGPAGRGDGRAAKMYTPRPADLTNSPFNDTYKELIVRRGGSAVGRSAFMPPWGDELSEEQIKDLIVYLQELRKTGTAR
jgi:mono/diheme cytochrome c family protein